MIPILVKSIFNYDYGLSEIEITSTNPKLKGTVSFERLKYLLDHGKIELLNAVIEDNTVQITENHTNAVRKFKLQFEEMEYGKIDDPCVLTAQQKSLSTLLQGTPLEINVAESSKSYDIVCKPYFIEKHNTYLLFAIHSYKTDSPSHLNVVVYLVEPGHESSFYYDWTLLFATQFAHTYIKYTNEDDVRNKINHILATLNNANSLNQFKDNNIFFAVIQDYFSDGNMWFDIRDNETVKAVKEVCFNLGIYEAYREMLIQRMVSVANNREKLVELQEYIKDKFNVTPPDIRTLITHYAFQNAHESYIFCDVNEAITHTVDRERREMDLKRRYEAYTPCGKNVDTTFGTKTNILTEFEMEGVLNDCIGKD